MDKHTKHLRLSGPRSCQSLVFCKDKLFSQMWGDQFIESVKIEVWIGPLNEAVAFKSRTSSNRKVCTDSRVYP